MCFLAISGPCTIVPKDPNRLRDRGSTQRGGHAIRGGVWKLRTNPYTYQGDDKTLDIIMEGSRRTGLPVSTEVKDERNLKLAKESGLQMLQIGRLTSSYRLPNILLISETQTSYCAPRHFTEFGGLSKSSRRIGHSTAQGEKLSTGCLRSIAFRW